MLVARELAVNARLCGRNEQCTTSVARKLEARTRSCRRRKEEHCKTGLMLPYDWYKLAKAESRRW